MRIGSACLLSLLVFSFALYASAFHESQYYVVHAHQKNATAGDVFSSSVHLKNRLFARDNEVVWQWYQAGAEEIKMVLPNITMVARLLSYARRISLPCEYDGRGAALIGPVKPFEIRWLSDQIYPF